MKKPLRMEICKLLLDNRARTSQEFITEMQAEYKGERQLLAMEEHLQSLRAVGIVAVYKEWVEQESDEEKLVQNWMLTQNGHERLNNFLGS